MMVQVTLVALFWFATVAAAVWLIRRMMSSADTRRRAFADFDEEAKAAAILQTDEMGFLRRWLFLAGYRQDSAVAWLVTSSVLTLLVGAAISAGMFLSGIYSTMFVATTAVPGGVGD